MEDASKKDVIFFWIMLIIWFMLGVVFGLVIK